MEVGIAIGVLLGSGGLIGGAAWWRQLEEDRAARREVQRRQEAHQRWTLTGRKAKGVSARLKKKFKRIRFRRSSSKQRVADKGAAEKASTVEAVGLGDKGEEDMEEEETKEAMDKELQSSRVLCVTIGESADASLSGVPREGIGREMSNREKKVRWLDRIRLNQREPASPSRYECDAADDAGTCSICFDDFGDQDCMQLPCKHIFHEDCIESWIGENVVCPLCKQDVQRMAEEGMDESSSSRSHGLLKRPSSLQNGDAPRRHQLSKRDTRRAFSRWSTM
ncbi:unnamed protein product [Chrysoparadoxa australica]